ncbi:hypothetical protein CHU95_16160 [Niveispirillum lacus]|uniref:Lipoprotein n=1 Tax=Niveispirillum lacus TaxID=1981099 RepID=A0A255YSY3_9PROT|nr:hypothetical protein [Niveispirillum lacus]OYQ32337.1 hypothetical protein CHU95_16160 [Niveispirillum lacus]
MMRVLRLLNWPILLVIGAMLSGCGGNAALVRDREDVPVLQGSGKALVYFSAGIDQMGGLFTSDYVSQPMLTLAVDPPVKVMENGVLVEKKLFFAVAQDRFFTLPAGRYGLANISTYDGGRNNASYRLGRIDGRWIIDFEVKEGDVLYLGHWHFAPDRQDPANVRLDIRVDDRFDQIAADLRQQLNKQERGRGDRLVRRLVVPTRSSVPLIAAPANMP